MSSESSLNACLDAENLVLVCLYLGKSVAPTPSGNFSFGHTTACDGLKPTPFLLKLLRKHRKQQQDRQTMTGTTETGKVYPGL